MNARPRLPEALRKVIDGYRRRWRLICTQTGLLVTLGVLACTVGLAAAADRLLRLSPALRAGALAVIGAASAVCLARWVLWPALRRMRDRDAAARLGHSFPRVEEDLVSAVELSADGVDRRGVSPGLIESALQQISGRARTVDYRAAVPVRPLLKAAGAVLVVLAIFAAAYQVRPEAVRNALVRLFYPSAGVPFFSYTKLSLQPGDAVVRVGDAVEVVAATSGRPASVARLYGRKGDGADSVFVRIACENGVGRWDSGPLFKDFAYRVAAGDAVSPWHRVRVVPPPALTQKGALLTTPRYAGSRQRAIESLDGPLQVVEGTQVVILATPVRRGDEPQLQCRGEMRAGDERFALAPDAAGRLASAPFVPKKSGEYTIVLTDGFGLSSRAPESLFVRVVPDRVPVVTIPKPGRDVIALPGERLAVEAAARDEFGIRALALSYRILKGKEGGEPADRWQKLALAEGGPEAAELAGSTELDLDALGLVPGDVLEYRAEAADYADDAVLRRGASPIYRVAVLSEMEHLERILAQLKELQLELLRRAAAQKAQAANARRLEKSDEAREGARAAHERQLEETRATEHLARKLERLIPELARNRSTPTDMLARMEQLGRGTRSTAREPMTNAADQFARAAQGQQAPQGQPIPLRIAGEQADEAARRLEQLARLAERLQRQGILEKLAAEAEALAARERGLKDILVPLARDTLGTDPKAMKEDQRRKLQRLVVDQRSVKDGVDALGKEIEKAAASLNFSNPYDAATAEEAKEKLDEDKVSEKSATIARRLEENALFSQVPEQEAVAKSLTDVADILRRRGDDSLDAFAREIEEFIKRQKAINAAIEAAIKKDEKARRPAEIGGDQAALQRDVAEQASALDWLAREIALFRSQTAAKLEAAASEMGQGVTDLFAKALPEGLEHGKKALALLEDAREKFSQERPQMQQAAMDARMVRILLLLQRCLVGQKRVNTGTVVADKLRARAARDQDGFDRQAVALSNQQSKVRVDAGKLSKLLASIPGAAALVDKSAEKMDLSRIALGSGDTGKDTREVQRMALALLEKLLGGPCSGMGGMAGARAMAMMQMMAGGSPGGFAGGSNAPVLPASVGEANDEAWRRTRSRFDEQLGAAFETAFPTQYRDLLNAYFDRLRKEPPR